MLESIRNFRTIGNILRELNPFIIMSYRYEFDESYVGDLHIKRSNYKILQEAYRALRDELNIWNRRTLDQGASRPPYEQEVNDLNRILNWGDKQLADTNLQEITITGISIGSLRYAKAALMLKIYRQRQNLVVKSDQLWPDATLRSLDDAIEHIDKIAEKLKYEPSNVLWELIPKGNPPELSIPMQPGNHWDAFISHASEDKEGFVRPLAQALRARELSIWFDEFTLTVGDSLRRSIDYGLAHSRFGIVVISPHFLQKEWPQKELDGLSAREVGGIKIILPVWHNISAEEIRIYSPNLSDRVATLSTNGIVRVVDDLVQVIAAGIDTTTAN